MKGDDPIDKVGERLGRDCLHQQWSTPREISADRLLGIAGAAARQVVFSGLGIEVCQRCGAIRWPEGLHASESILAEMARRAESLVPSAKRIVVHWGPATFHRKATGATEGEDAVVEAASYCPQHPRYRLGDVILPAATQKDLADALVKVRFHSLIYDDWGFKKVDPDGRGVSLDFYGPPGTGKTRTAEALAGELGLPFLCVSAGEVESRFMGETPKNIKRAFDAARESKALLFFDEAESLFGRRASDVTQGVDHEVNVAKSTLLMELERFEGILVLASNFQEIYDTAFRRRITHHVRFDLPDRVALDALVKMHVVPGIPTEGARQELIDQLVALLDGILPPEDRFSGADILTMVRLALPAAISQDPSQPIVTFEHFGNAVESILRAKREVGRRGRFLGRRLQETRFAEKDPSGEPASTATATNEDNQA